MTKESVSKVGATDGVTRPIGRQGWALGGLVAATAASLVLSINAWSASPTPPMPGASMPGMDAPMMKGERAGMGKHHEHRGEMGQMGQDRMPGHGLEVDARFIERLLDDVKATDAQRAQIRQIGDKARAELRALQAKLPPPKPGEMMGPMSLLTQPKVDATEIEQRRQQLVSYHDVASKLQVRALVDIANVLTPEQRHALAERQQAALSHMPPHGADQRQPVVR